MSTNSSAAEAIVTHSGLRSYCLAAKYLYVWAVLARSRLPLQMNRPAKDSTVKAMAPMMLKTFPTPMPAIQGLSAKTKMVDRR